MEKIIINEPDYVYLFDYKCSVSSTGFIRSYTGYFTEDISSALDEILSNDWFFDRETNNFMTKDKLIEISNIPVFNVYYRELFNVYELLICDADDKILFTADIVEWDEFFGALKKYEIH